MTRPNKWEVLREAGWRGPVDVDGRPCWRPPEPDERLFTTPAAFRVVWDALTDGTANYVELPNGVTHLGPSPGPKPDSRSPRVLALRDAGWEQVSAAGAQCWRSPDSADRGLYSLVAAWQHLVDGVVRLAGAEPSTPTHLGELAPNRRLCPRRQYLVGDKVTGVVVGIDGDGIEVRLPGFAHTAWFLPAALVEVPAPCP